MRQVVLLKIPARKVFTWLVGEGRGNLPLTPPMPSEEGNGESIPRQNCLLAFSIQGARTITTGAGVK